MSGIVQYGWGAFVFAGVAAVCLIIFAASILMVSWRYFNPLANQSATPSEGHEASTQDISRRLAENKAGLEELRTSTRDISRRLAEAERGIAQNKAGLEELRTSTHDISRRFAEAERGIAQHKAGLEEVRTKAAMVTRSLRARDARSIVEEADQVVMSSYKKLLEDAHPDEAAWADDYAAWEKAMSRIDTVMSQWTQQHHEPFLDIRSKDLEGSAPPPQHIESDANATRYKTAWVAQLRYADRREGLFGYFAAIIGDV
jgi:chromosome segregation ATPase